MFQIKRIFRHRATRNGVVVVAAVGMITLVACSSPELPTQPPATAPPSIQTQPTSPPAATAVPPAAPTAMAQPELTPAPAATNVPAPPTPTAAPIPTSAPTPTEVPTPVPTATVEVQPTPVVALTTISDFGFALKVERQTQVSSAGWTESDASQEQGVLRFPYGGVNVLLRWIPGDEGTPSSVLADSFGVLRSSQPNLQFNAISEGELEVGGEPGAFGGFAAADSSGAVLGGGLIGAWLCQSPARAFSLTVTGQGATTAQIRFQNLVDNFSCSAQ